MNKVLFCFLTLIVLGTVFTMELREDQSTCCYACNKILMQEDGFSAEGFWLCGCETGHLRRLFCKVCFRRMERPLHCPECNLELHSKYICPHANLTSAPDALPTINESQ